MSNDLRDPWPEWYQDRNVIRIAAKVFLHLLPAMAIVAGIGTTMMVVLGYIANPPSTWAAKSVEGFLEGYFWLAVWILVNAIIAGCVGMGAAILTTTFDWSIGKVMGPIGYGAAVVGCSIIPTAIQAISLEAFSIYPDGNFYVFRTYIGMISISALIGIFRAKSLVGEVSGPAAIPVEYHFRQFMVLAAWVGSLCFLSWTILGWAFLIAIAIYLATVLVVLCTYKILNRMLLNRNPISNNDVRK